MTRVADEVLGKFARQQNDVFRRVREGSLSPEKAFRMHRQLLGNLLVQFDPIKLWDVLVKDGGYDGVYINKDFNPAVHLPPLPPKGEVEVNLRERDTITTTAEWLALLDNNTDSQDRFVHPLVMLAIGASEEYRDEQQDAPIFVVWFDSDGQLWCLVLCEGAGYRYLSVYRDGLDDCWCARYRAAAAAK